MTDPVLRILLPLVLSLGMGTAQTPSLTGAWDLNVAKSNWGKKAKPQSVEVTIEHSEPDLKYSGVAVDAQEHTRHFEFAGKIDGKEYPVAREYGEGKITLKRANPATLNSEFRSTDGRFVERATTTLSKDGKTLTRQMRLKSPDGNLSWTEIYEKR